MQSQGTEAAVLEEKVTGHSPYLSRSPLNVGGDFVQAQGRPLCSRYDGGNFLQEVGQVSRNSACLIAVKFRKGLGLKILKHKQGIFPYKVHLEKRQTVDYGMVHAERKGEVLPQKRNVCADEVIIQ